MPSPAPGQFRKATATGSIARIYHGAGDPAATATVDCSIDEVEATFDDESGNVELRIDLSASASGNQTTTLTPTVSFQVTTLSKL